MRLDIVPVEAIKVEVEWDTLDTRHKHTNIGRIRFHDVDEEFRIRLVRTKFGGGFSIYAITDQMNAEELNKFDKTKGGTYLPLPEALKRFVGGTFTLYGAAAGRLGNQLQAIELIGEVPEGYRGNPFREALYRRLDAPETIRVFGALGMTLTLEDFQTFPA